MNYAHLDELAEKAFDVYFRAVDQGQPDPPPKGLPDVE